MTKRRKVKRIVETLGETGLTRIPVVDPMSTCYPAGAYVEPSERLYALYLREDGNHMYFLNKLFTMPEDMSVEKVWYSGTDPAAEIVAGYLDKENPLGADKNLKTWFLLPPMETGTATGFVNSSIAMDRTGGVKDEGEQGRMRAAFGINDGVMAEFKKLIHEGVTGRQVAGQMLKIYMDLGADGFSFEPLMTFGANAADPHHGPDGTAIKPGNSVLFDMGCIKDEYCSNMTRTFYFRKASDEYRRTYEIVCSASETAISKIRPGIPPYEPDGTVRDLVAEQGYGPLFTHRLGHLISLGEHGFGDVSSVNTQKTEPRMIFSIGPGIYLFGDTGVRVEDPILVIEEGCEALNHYPREFEMIG